MNKLGLEDPLKIKQCHQMGHKQQNKLHLRTIVCCSNKFKEKEKTWPIQTN